MIGRDGFIQAYNAQAAIDRRRQIIHRAYLCSRCSWCSICRKYARKPNRDLQVGRCRSDQFFGRGYLTDRRLRDHIQGPLDLGQEPMFVLLEVAIAVALGQAIFAWAGETVFTIAALIVIVLIARMGGAASFALPDRPSDTLTIVAADLAIVAVIRSWRRNICDLHAKGECAWSLILVGPAVTLILAAVAASLLDS